MGCLASSIFFSFLQWANLIGPSLKKKKKLWRLPRIEVYILQFRVPSLWPSYIDERRTYGIKVRCYGEHLGNILRTWWETIGNSKGTWWEHIGNERKMVKKSCRPTKLKRKKKHGTFNTCLGLPIGCMKFLFAKEFLTNFWPGLIPFAKNTIPM
jgi:hypothetical protein